MTFNKGFSRVKEIIDESQIEYYDLEVLEANWTFIGGAYIKIGELPVMIQLNDREKNYVITIESDEGTLINSQTTNRKVVIDLLKELEKG